ncbi:MAG: hypothetical protein ACYDCO_05000 [Armatimonadota bacterium]
MSLQKLSFLLAGLLLVVAAAHGDETPAQEIVPVVIATKAIAEPAPYSPQVMMIDDVHRFPQDRGLDAPRRTLSGEEFVLTGQLTSQLQGYLDLTLDPQDVDADVKEAFATFQPFSPKLEARAGTMLVPFGLVNPVQPRHFPFADTPTVIHNLLGNEFTGDGYELMVDGLGGHVHWRAGQYATHTAEDADEVLNFTESFFVSRLSFSGKGITDERADVNGMKMGASVAVAKDSDLSLIGLDGSWKFDLKDDSSLLLQTEAIRRRRGDQPLGWRHEFGYYLMGIYRHDRNWEFGARYDWSEIPNVGRHRESGASLFGTHYLNDANYLRLQLKRNTVSGVSENAVLLQLVYRFGGEK